jgi:hypothetical protein
VPPVAPVIANAIYNIAKVRARSLPLADQTLATEEMMLRAKRTAEVQQQDAVEDGTSTGSAADAGDAAVTAPAAQ